jgi:GxxExxY protein
VDEDEISRHLVDAAIAVHKVLGPGLLESAYVAAMEIELTHRDLHFEREAPINATYRGQALGIAYRADLLVRGKVLIEVKSVQSLETIHVAQLLSYLRLGGWKLGLLLNFNTTLMKSGIRRVVNDL